MILTDLDPTALMLSDFDPTDLDPVWPWPLLTLYWPWPLQTLTLPTLVLTDLDAYWPCPYLSWNIYLSWPLLNFTPKPTLRTLTTTDLDLWPLTLSLSYLLSYWLCLPTLTPDLLPSDFFLLLKLAHNLDPLPCPPVIFSITEFDHWLTLSPRDIFSCWPCPQTLSPVTFFPTDLDPRLTWMFLAPYLTAYSPSWLRNTVRISVVFPETLQIHGSERKVVHFLKSIAAEIIFSKYLQNISNISLVFTIEKLSIWTLVLHRCIVSIYSHVDIFTLMY